MSKQPSRCLRLIAAVLHVELAALATSPHGQLHVRQIKQAIVTRVYRGLLSTHQRFAQLKLASTHPPHVLVSAKVLLQSRRAKGGFSFGRKVLHG
jgi:hypothetical protein